MTSRNALALTVAMAALGYAASAHANRAHVVSRGDTLWGISRNYGCDLGALRQSNALAGDTLAVGQTLSIPCGGDQSSDDEVQVAMHEPVSARAEKGAHTHVETAYVIRSGDTLGGIAARFDTSVDKIIASNHLKNTTIYPGQTLEFESGLPALPTWTTGQSIGLPHHGSLADARKLPKGPGYFIRRPYRAYGATHTVERLAQVLVEQRQRFPGTHRLAIGDLSAEKGGKITRHASHQSGRDVDLGFYFKKKPKTYPEEFVVATAKNLDFDATWALLTSFTNMADEEGGVEKIFLSYDTQRLFYRLARKHGVSKAVLASMFQYPRGKSSPEGLIRHEPGHDEHMHVRFKCPPDDQKCH